MMDGKCCCVMSRLLLAIFVHGKTDHKKRSNQDNMEIIVKLRNMSSTSTGAWESHLDPKQDAFCPDVKVHDAQGLRGVKHFPGSGMC